MKFNLSKILLVLRHLNKRWNGLLFGCIEVDTDFSLAGALSRLSSVLVLVVVGAVSLDEELAVK